VTESRTIFAPPIAAKDRLIFALDFDQIDEAEGFVQRLAPHVGMFKVGPRLFTCFGLEIIDRIHERGSKLFLDLKLHDIPETVSGAAREIARLRASMFTVHALGGREMIRRSVDELVGMTLIPGNPLPMCLAVTILTSHSQKDLEELGFTGPIAEHAVRLAKLAMDAGAGGIVASGHELEALRPALPAGTAFVVPGIRSQSDPLQDQTRVMTAYDAIRAGATHLVVGRPIRMAANPEEAAKRIVDEIARALEA
jgi:orotidine-5'-phosphate decarboxylase